MLISIIGLFFKKKKEKSENTGISLFFTEVPCNSNKAHYFHHTVVHQHKYVWTYGPSFHFRWAAAPIVSLPWDKRRQQRQIREDLN